MPDVAIPRKYAGADAHIRPNGIARRDDVGIVPYENVR